MTKSQKTILVVLVHIGSSIFLLGRELPEIPIHWWGWLVPFALPTPIYFFLSKLEIPKEPPAIQTYHPVTRALVWDFRMTQILVIVYFLFLFVIWVFVKPFLYEQ